MALDERKLEVLRAIVADYYRGAGAPLIPDMVESEPPRIWKPDDEEYFAMTVDVMAALVKVACGETLAEKDR